MKSYAITVNGVPYYVTVEELAQGSAMPQPMAPAQVPVQAAPTQPAAVQAAPAAPQAKSAPAQAVSASDTQIESPLPGTLLDFKVKVGDVVKQNAVVAIVEAMKMENEVVATCAGKVTSLVASKGASLNAGDVLMTIAQ